MSFSSCFSGWAFVVTVEGLSSSVEPAAFFRHFAMYVVVFNGNL